MTKSLIPKEVLQQLSKSKWVIVKTRPRNGVPKNCEPKLHYIFLRESFALIFYHSYILIMPVTMNDDVVQTEWCLQMNFIKPGGALMLSSTIPFRGQNHFESCRPNAWMTFLEYRLSVPSLSQINDSFVLPYLPDK